MSRAWVFALVAGSAAAAAPVPPESDAQKVARLWGKVRVPSKECAVKPDGALLTLRTAGYPVGFGYSAPPFQVTREVVGDFDARVKVFALDLPSRAVYYQDTPQTAAGLHIDGGNCSVALYRWMTYHKNNGVLQNYLQDCAWVAHRAPGAGGGSYLTEWEAGQSRYFRVVRKGDTITAGVSADGKEWKEWDAARQGLKLPPAVTVGLFLGHTTSQECAASFADFAVEKPK